MSLSAVGELDLQSQTSYYRRSHTVRFMTVVQFSCQLPYILSGSWLLYNFPASYPTYCPVHDCCTIFLPAILHTVRFMTAVQFSCQLSYILSGSWLLYNFPASYPTYCPVHDCCTIFLPATIHTVRFMTIVQFSCQLPYIQSGSWLLYNFPAIYRTYCPVHDCCTIFLPSWDIFGESLSGSRGARNGKKWITFCTELRKYFTH